jgi:hypothetical protein
LLERLLADKTIAKEEQNATHALARVDVAGEVAVTVADEVGRARAPLIP